MNRQSYVLCCCMLLFITSSSDSRRNFKNNDEQSTDSTVLQDLHSKKDPSDKDELIQNNLCENSTDNYDEVQCKFCINSTEDNHSTHNNSTHCNFRNTIKTDKESNQMELESIKTSSMKVNDENNFASEQFYGNFTNTEGKNNYTIDDNDNSTFPNETCQNDTCIQLCCPHGDRLIEEKCVSGEGNYSFPDVYGYTSNDSSQSKDKSLDELFQVIVENPCVAHQTHLFVDPNEYLIFANGSLYLQSYGTLVSTTSYCLAAVNGDVYDVIICKSWFPIFITICIIVSVPCLLATFVVYSILPELQNMHGHTLRAHVISLFVSYAILPVFHQIALLEMSYPVCVLLGYIFNFSFLASMFWLNVICFDIWYAFREIHSSQGNVKQQERTKFMLYSIYAWGVALLFDIICAITDYVPGIPKYFVPEYCKHNPWFSNFKAKAIYFYLPVGITLICNICFFVLTAVKIVRDKRRTANDLRNSESRRHDANKQRFIMYLKLFIVMGITWIMEVVSWLHSGNVPNIIWYPTDIINSLQGAIIFIIFVCRKKIMRLLLKRLGWQNCSVFGKKSVSSDRHSSTTTISSTLSMHNISTRTQAN